MPYLSRSILSAWTPSLCFHLLHLNRQEPTWAGLQWGQKEKREGNQKHVGSKTKKIERKPSQHPKTTNSSWMDSKWEKWMKVRDEKLCCLTQREGSCRNWCQSHNIQAKLFIKPQAACVCPGVWQRQSSGRLHPLCMCVCVCSLLFPEHGQRVEMFRSMAQTHSHIWCCYTTEEQRFRLLMLQVKNYYFLYKISKYYYRFETNDIHVGFFCLCVKHDI